MREFYFPWSTRIPTPLKTLPPEVLQELEELSDEELDQELAEQQKYFDDKERSWLSNYDSNGKLRPGVILSRRDYSTGHFMLRGVEPEDEAAYIVSEKRRLGVL